MQFKARVCAGSVGLWRASALPGSAALAAEVPAQDALFEDTPAWQDEFDRDGAPDPAKWGYDTGGHGWGNNELQYYRSQNVAVAGGNLVHGARPRTGEVPGDLAVLAFVRVPEEVAPQRGGQGQDLLVRLLDDVHARRRRARYASSPTR